MSRTPAIEMRRLEASEHPVHETVVAKANEYLCRRAVSMERFAQLVGIGHSSAKFFVRGEYKKNTGATSTQYMDARIWEYLRRNWPSDAPPPAADLIETRGYRKILACVEEAVDEGVISVVYGPPSSEKSYVAQNLAAQYREAGRRDLLYAMCSPDTSPLAILREICREAEVWTRGTARYPIIEALVVEFGSRKRPPAILVDEAQNLTVEALETLRVDLYERLKRATGQSCGIVFLGSHNLYARFEHFAARFNQEQLLSRVANRVQLEGMTEEEVLRITARALGNGKPAKLNEAQRAKFLNACRVPDLYATGEDGKRAKEPKFYYSSRRLLETVRQMKRGSLDKVLAQEVA